MSTFEELYRRAQKEYQETEVLYDDSFLTQGTNEEFCDYLDTDEADMFRQMAELAEQKKKWLSLFEKMQKSIKAREFDKAYTLFEDLAQELF